MANMPGVGLEIFKAGGGWRDQKWAPPRSVKLPSLRQGRMQTLPCSLGSARFPTLERGKPKLSALKRWGRGDCAFCLLNRVRESAVFLALWAGEGRLCVLPAQQSGGDFAFFLVFKGEEIRVFHEKNREGGGDFAFSSI
ncbi:hypothetical protein T4C_3473 [Trichinella pseudospiralis]|uniref:Uncharacterized protein n=1 Tax=Trichinella pseudospiralis TaxID=6337 RepID=A0A0V1ISB9_TRIPS|nr:hypothetical protein T4C_3473 [Trichinella pseudospiralis]